MIELSAYENAVALARLGFRVFPATGKIWGPNSDLLATCDLALLEKINAIDPQANWLVRCGAEFGLLCLDTPRAIDLELLVNDMGKLPSTLIVTRPTGGPVRWFKCPPDADIKLGVAIGETRAKFKSVAIIPGSFNGRGERYDVLLGRAFDMERRAYLPDSWLRALPKNSTGMGVTANLVVRHEFSPNARSSEFDYY